MNDRTIAVSAILAVVAAGMMYYIIDSANSPGARITTAQDDQKSGNLIDYSVQDFTDRFYVEPEKEPAATVAAPQLEVRGAWTKPTLTVFAESDFEFDAETFVQRLLDESPENKILWNSLLYEKRLQYGDRIPVLLSGENNDADISIMLKKEYAGAGLAKTRLYLDDKTVVKASILINVQQNVDEKTLLAIASHELGHALGLGHSTSEASIMSSAIAIDGSNRESEIGACESKALEQLYVDRNFGTVIC